MMSISREWGLPSVLCSKLQKVHIVLIRNKSNFFNVSNHNQDEQWDQYHELHRMVIQNDIQGIEDYIAANKDINARDENVMGCYSFLMRVNHQIFILLSIGSFCTASCCGSRKFGNV